MAQWLGVLFFMLLAALPASASSRGVPVTVTATDQRPIFQTVRLNGTVTSPKSATLSALTSGLVANLLVDDGARVEAGELLLELDSELAKLQLDNFNAGVDQAQIALQDARRRLLEAERLIEQKSIAKSSVKDIETEVARAQALLAQSIANQQYQQELITRHSLTAPFAGIISQKHTELGEWVSPGDGVLELVAIDDLRLDFRVAEDYLARLDNNHPLSFRLSSNPNTLYEGDISAIVPILDPATRTFLLRVRVQSPQGNIMPGMSVNALLEVPTGRDGIVVPRDALLRYPDGRVIVWTVAKKPEGWFAEEKVVKPGVSFDHYIEIIDGLSPGERVVVRGNESLQNGQAVLLYREMEL